jgi:hypothetical protein
MDHKKKLIHSVLHIPSLHVITNCFISAMKSIHITHHNYFRRGTNATRSACVPNTVEAAAPPRTCSADDGAFLTTPSARVNTRTPAMLRFMISRAARVCLNKKIAAVYILPKSAKVDAPPHKSHSTITGSTFLFAQFPSLQASGFTFSSTSPQAAGPSNVSSMS